MSKATISFCLAFSIFVSLQAQVVDYNRQYFNAKQLFREGKYNLAMESFKPLIPYDKNNQFSQYASFFYALSAYNLGFKAVAKDQLLQLKTQHSTWDKMDDVNFWLGKIHLENKDYFQGMKVLAAIRDKKMEKEVDALKTKALAGVTDLETLKMMREESPKDEPVARALANALAKDIANTDNRALLESLVKQYNWKKEQFIPEAPKSFTKDVYTVSVVMPFMVNTLDATPTRKRNQIVLDFYEGMKLALDTLARLGVKISLRAYDTERSPAKMKTLLATDELKSSDLLVGPFFPEENKALQDFSLNNKINLFNPFSNNTEVIGTNPYAFLYQPSLEAIGQKSGELMADRLRKRNCIVYYGTSRRDSVLAANFVARAHERGVKILQQQRITKESVGKIMSTLATATEYDEFRYPKQFTLKKDSLGGIFVATDDALIYAKVLGGVETRGDSVMVIGSEIWIEQSAVDIDKFQSLKVLLAAPNFSVAQNPHYRAFVKRFLKTHGRPPSNDAKMGYEFMLFAGGQLKKGGVYFQEEMSKQGFIPGTLVEGYHYPHVRANQLVPFVRFKNGKGMIVDKR